MIEARDCFLSALKDAKHTNIIRVYAAYPWVLEMLFECESRNIEIPEDFSFDISVERVMQDINLCLKGVLMRLLAKRAAAKGEPIENVDRYLNQSIDFLNRSGAVVQLARTQLELTRFELTKGKSGTSV